jgi:hypothetical protein
MLEHSLPQNLNCCFYDSVNRGKVSVIVEQALLFHFDDFIMGHFSQDGYDLGKEPLVAPYHCLIPIDHFRKWKHPAIAQQNWNAAFKSK